MIDHPFSTLESEYLGDLASMTVIRPREVDAIAQRLLKYVESHYSPVSEKTGVPVIWLAATGEREAGEDIFFRYFGNGDSLLRPTRDVPRGRGPFVDVNGRPDWVAGTIDALGLDHIDEVPKWDWARACYEWELWNGFGPRAHGRRTGYLWSGTELYDGGKYIADGQWSPTARDQQLGTVPIARRMAELEPALDLPDWPLMGPALARPATTPFGLHDAWTLQKALNRLDNAGLVVDGSFGRRTTEAVRAFQGHHGLDVDGVAGPETWAAITKEMAGA